MHGAQRLSRTAAAPSSERWGSLWLQYLAGGVVTVMGYLLVDSLVVRNLLFIGFYVATVGAVVAGIRLHRPQRPLAWQLWGAAQVCLVAASVVYAVYEVVLGRPPPVPSIDDLPYLLTYPLTVAGLLVCARNRTSGGDRASLLDALSITVGLGVAAWALVLAPAMERSLLSAGAMAVTLAHPVGSTLVFAVAVRLALDGPANTSLRLIGAAVGLYLLAYSGFAAITIAPEGSYRTGSLLDVLWQLSAVLWGAAALHPSMASVDEPEDAPPRGVRLRRGALVGAALAAPLVAAVQLGRGDEVAIAPLLLGAAVLPLLAFARVLEAFDAAEARAEDNRRLLAELRESSGRLRDSEQRLRSLFDHSPDAVYSQDLQGRFTSANPAAEALTGLTVEQLRATPPIALLAPDQVGNAVRRFRDAVAGQPQHYPTAIVPAGRRVELELVNIPIRIDGDVVGVYGVAADVTELHRAQRELARRAGQQSALATLGARALAATEPRALLDDALGTVAAILEAPLAAVWRLDAEGRRMRLYAARGWPPQDRGVVSLPADATSSAGAALVQGAPVFVEDITTDDRFLAAAPLAGRGARSGMTVAIAHSGPQHTSHRRPAFGALAVYDEIPRRFTEEDAAFLQAVADVLAAALDRHRVETETRHRALHDALTGLPNRTLLADRLQQALAGAARSGSEVGLLLLDLDGFKDINDSLGHEVGDAVLQRVAQRIGAAGRASDTVARLGGDEFAVCLPGLGEAVEAVAVAEKITAALSEPLDVSGMSLPIGASIGVALAPHHGASPSALLQHADVAMYRAKRARLPWAVYDIDVDALRTHRLGVVSALRAALDRGGLAVHYQPVISLDSGAALGAEALVRWVGDADAHHAPEDFIAVAETSGLIRPLTTWVLSTAIRDAARWGALGMNLSVAVNMSGVVLQDHELRRRIERLLRANALPASSLALEITESVILHERARDALGRMVVSGVTFAVDDFGTGYSSLAYLKRLPVQCLKIDRAFVTGMDRDPRDAAIVRSVIDMAHTLDLRVIAEGVETERVSQLLAGMGCDAAQGFHYARPMPAPQLESWLRERDASHPARRRART